jgi:hypothetical protein
MTQQTLPNWKPPERILSPLECQHFTHIGTIGTIEQYKHRDTPRYLNIDSRTGEFYLYGNNTFTSGSAKRQRLLMSSNDGIGPRPSSGK